MTHLGASKSFNKHLLTVYGGCDVFARDIALKKTNKSLPLWDLYPTGRQIISKQIIKYQTVISLSAKKKTKNNPAVLGADSDWFQTAWPGKVSLGRDLN